MAAVWPWLYAVLMVLMLFLNVFGLPGNWAIVALLAIWKLLNADLALSWGFIGLVGGVAALGEALEFGLSYFTGRKAGSTAKGNIGGFVGMIAGAILGAPIFFGLGALPGALLGAFAGCLIMEKSHGRPWPEANKAAVGVMVGSFLGIIAKFSLGVVMLVLALPRLF